MEGGSPRVGAAGQRQSWPADRCGHHYYSLTTPHEHVRAYLNIAPQATETTDPNWPQTEHSQNLVTIPSVDPPPSTLAGQAAGGRAGPGPAALPLSALQPARREGGTPCGAAAGLGCAGGLGCERL